MMPGPHPSSPLLVAGFYNFTRLDDLPAYRAGLLAACDQASVLGTILLAPEGVNGTLCGTPGGIARALQAVRALPGCAALRVREEPADRNPFYRMKVRLKREIITMGIGDLDPAREAGTTVEPEDWNAVLEDPGTIVIDTRNSYEVRVGTFEGAVDPELDSFGAFPDWFERYCETHGVSRVAMFCTGGIRCEKSTALARRMGLQEVFHLKGGILNYLNTIPETASKWRGECFVFDQRVAVGHGLAPGCHEVCFACRMPFHRDEKADPRYVPGVSCPRCHGAKARDDRSRFAERERQVRLAARRGTPHLGAQGTS